MKKITLVLFAMFFAGIHLSLAQNIQVTGTVTDEKGSPMAGVTIIIEGTTRGVSTLADGTYSIQVPADGTLSFSFVGKVAQRIAINNRSVINVVMQTDTQFIEDVIIVAYGTAKAPTYTGSASVVDKKKLADRPVSNVTKALEGVVPGILTTSGSGQPGSSSDIRIRGIGSINSSSAPLYVVDGAPFTGAISSINPEDIASITILKDASAGALYGARGANGVILINTKRGANREGKTLISFKGSWGISSRALPRYETLDEKDYIEQNYLIIKNELIYDEGVDPDLAATQAIQRMVYGNRRIFGDDQRFNPYNVPADQLIDPATGKLNPEAELLWDQDWMDEVTREAPLRQEYNVSISGGSDKTNYYSSIGYLNEQGILQTTSFERISARMNLTNKIKDWLHFNGSLTYTNSDTQNQSTSGTAYSNVWFSAESMGPIYPVFVMDRNGDYVLDGTGNRIYDWSSDRPGGASPEFNSAGLLHQDHYYTKSDQFSSNGQLAIRLDDDMYGWAKGLNFSTGISTNLYFARGTTYYNPDVGNAGGETKGRLSKTSTRTFNYTFNQLIGYERTFNNDHNIYFKGGHEFYQLVYNYLGGSKTNFPLPGLEELSPGVTIASLDSYEDKYAIESWFGQVKYSFRDKYNFDASLRTDASSRFKKESRWGTFWSLGANWRISEEEFMRPITWIDNLSFRISYGVQGNDNLGGYYLWQAFYELSLPNAGNSAAYVSSLETPDLRWEKNGNFNVGIETRLFNRVNFTFEYFSRKTTDMLFAVPMASSLGFGSYNSNVGEMVNNGFEVSIAADIVRSENFNWRLTLIGNHYKNEIKKLVTDAPIISGTYILQEGSPIWSYYMPESPGVDPATGQKLYWVWDKSDPVTGEPLSDPYISTDVNLAENSRRVVGSKQPDFYGSIGSEFRILKNIDLSFLTTYSIGGVAYDSQYLSYLYPSYQGSAIHEDVLQAWQQPGDVTDIPRIKFNDSSVITTSNDLIDASYFAIKNITLGYTFPENITSKLGVSLFRIYATVDNLYMFNHLKGFDPQSSYFSSSSYTYTPVRTVSVGVNINF